MKNIPFQIRLTDGELKVLKSVAKLTGGTVSSVIRYALYEEYKDHFRDYLSSIQNE